MDLLRRLGAPLDVVAESHQPEVLREMVRLGTGWTVLPVSQAEYGDRPLGGGHLLTTRNLVMATRAAAPAIAAVYLPAQDEMLITRPSLRVRMEGNTACVQ